MLPGRKANLPRTACQNSPEHLGRFLDGLFSVALNIVHILFTCYNKSRLGEKMKKYPCLVLLLCAALLSFGGSETQDQSSSTIKLKGNITTGYTWVCTISPGGIVREVTPYEYIQDNINGPPGSGGTFVFTFEAIAPGEAELVFSYLRSWESVPALQTETYRAIVDDKNNLTLRKK